MDTKKIAVFLEAVKMGSLKKTAEKLNYTQSGLIYLMNSLENELGGLKLLNRTSKGVCLTEEGIALEPYIRQIYESEGDLIDKIHEIQREGTRKLRIGTYPIYACDGLPGVIKTFLDDHPDNDITIRVATGQELPKLLSEDDIDLAIGEAGLVKDAAWIPLMEYEIYSAIPQAFDIGEEESITFEALKDYPLLFSSYNQVSNQIEKLLERENPYKIKVESSDGSALLHMVSEGLGVAFLSSLYLKECPQTVTMRPLDPPLTKELGVLAKHEKMNSPLIKAFLPYLKEAQ
ncbi:MAG: LysR family transcriptional regulator [Clostridiales Family XIII bacterium]|uniref:LysR family transcriptional regulator n=1 Tax=Hominibacterium faecale TaxID=2839743 RepID=UPI0022B29981|nr:LysR family transcriptional regulator [Hominibacterium faecale]MCI7301736.1 LysR family transcriptional regulator [Clostridia bacterium]MDE8734412.1 LysR family transcriptional regulator [Eubacteriales bacterium DFI.9.88]MDY3010086.1 LysR family transcriptional regulator [Clostridiales Family XIII bacterium]